MTTWKSWAAGVLLAWSAATAAPGATHTLTLGVLDTLPPSLLQQRMEPLSRYLDSQVPGVHVELRVLGPAEMEAALDANRLDLVLTNPSHYLVLRSRNALTGALVTVVRQHAGQATSSLGGVVVVRTHSPLRQLADLRGRRVAAHAGRTLDGWQAPAYELQQIGIDPLRELQLRWVPSSRDGLDDLLAGRVDAAFVRSGLLEDPAALPGVDVSSLRVLNEQRFTGYPYAVSTRLYPEWPVLALPHVSAGVLRRVAAALMSLDSTHPAARAAGLAGFNPPADYLPAEQLARAVRAPPYDIAPEISLADIWQQQRLPLMLAALAAGVIVLLAAALARRNRLLRGINRDLGRSRRLLQGVIETVPVQVYWKDRQGRTLGHNRGDAGTADTPLPALAGADALLPVEREVLRSGRPRLDEEAVFTRDDGSAGWQRRSTVPLRDEDGSVIGVLGTLDDITWLKQQQQALAAARDQLQATIDAVPDLLFEVDEDGVYLHVHAPQRGLLAAPLENLLGRRIADILPADAAAVCRQALDAALAQGHSTGHEYRLDLPDGTRWFELSAAVKRRDEGERPRFVVVSRDITDRRRALDELEAHRHQLEALVARRTAELSAALQVAERASVAKSEFLANMSHEIRTPLNAVLGMGHLLRRSPLNDKQRGWLDALSSSGEHLLEVLGAILDLSKIEAGRLTLDLARTDLRAVVEEARAMMQGRATAKGLALDLRLPAQLPAVQADATRLRQALLNLVHNAIKFTSAGGVQVRLQLEGDAASPEVLARFKVHDTGIGIAADVLPRLFATFEQADNSSTRAYGGTGLGLAITRRLAQLMGGDAGAQSTPGQGSVFWFTARLQRDESSPAQASPASEGAPLEQRLLGERAGRRVLLVEDDPINREVTRELLGAVGQTVLCADDGEQAVAQVAAGAVDLVLMDMQMPRMDGLVATQRIRALPHGRDVPIVALTANAFAEDRERCLQAGMNDFITKPLDMTDLVSVLWRWLP